MLSVLILALRIVAIAVNHQLPTETRIGCDISATVILSPTASSNFYLLSGELTKTRQSVLPAFSIITPLSISATKIPSMLSGAHDKPTKTRARIQQTKMLISWALNDIYSKLTDGRSQYRSFTQKPGMLDNKMLCCWHGHNNRAYFSFVLQ